MAGADEQIKRFNDIGKAWGFQLSEEYEDLLKLVRGQKIPYDEGAFPILRWRSGSDQNLYKTLRSEMRNSKSEILKQDINLADITEGIADKKWFDNLRKKFNELYKSKAAAAEYEAVFKEFSEKAMYNAGERRRLILRSKFKDITKAYFGDEKSKDFYLRRNLVFVSWNQYADQVLPCEKCGVLHEQYGCCTNPNCPSNPKPTPNNQWNPNPQPSNPQPRPQPRPNPQPSNPQPQSRPSNPAPRSRAGFPYAPVLVSVVICVVIYFALFNDSIAFSGLPFLRGSDNNRGNVMPGFPKPQTSEPNTHKSSETPRSEYPYTAQIKGTKVNIRTGPTKGAKSYGLFNSDLTLKVTGESGSWRKVEFRDTSGKTNVGWVHGDYVAKVPGGIQSPQNPKAKAETSKPGTVKPGATKPNMAERDITKPGDTQKKPDTQQKKPANNDARINKLLAEAKSLQNQGRVDDALEKYYEVQKIPDGDSKELRDTLLALEKKQKEIKKKNDEAATYEKTGDYLLSQGKYAEAKAQYKKSLLFNENPIVRGKYDGAEALEKSVRLEAEGDALMARNDYAGAMNKYKESYQIVNDSAVETKYNQAAAKRKQQLEWEKAGFQILNGVLNGLKR
jgi:predicted negative regulator of RcsB-dependent stress response